MAIELLTPTQIDEMRPAGRFVADVLTTLVETADVGTDLIELDALAHRMIRDRGAESCYIDYAPSFGRGPFGYVLCTSVNDAVLHGLPHRYKLRDGDLVSFDFAVAVDGWVCDSAVSRVVGTPRDEDLRLIEATEVALARAIEVARPGKKVGDISAVIGETAREYGYPVNTQFGGHGVGRTMHGDPHISNDGKAGRGFPLKPGLVIAIEPWFLASTDEIRMDDDGWTIRSADGSRGAHSEHTIAITEGDPIIMTARD
ncbi:type I methionyl aminopeptidase [Aeromicrobium sp. 636]|uniref:Methionine aminopeptidase n=1 Tax=Aeromicrobium senzhongii TaxID=2663859 RepID=A0A8I0EY55_9ACTN|nr:MULTISPECIES: type I methionyl aminopeptidase [Aeromicrobium]MBC9227687.1 type I methionyl aminopeptidase [Aeromicrobium senzhongii]MCQ3999784.1 type I methionyl aminopeptidase [Aeromicrobium sp. 636]MTB89703.1 type I methionyl aminopeptidase [Aeromicrobium senzhongii]QNL94175.1 type I methionyl aminopeptidase [Aeromicrobium senzhongii]